MASTITPIPPAPSSPRTSRHLVPGLVLVALGVMGASAIQGLVGGIPLIVAAVLTGAMIGNADLVHEVAQPGLSFASKQLLRAGIVLLGLRLSLGDVTGLGVRTLVVIVATVTATFVVVQIIGRKMGLSLSLSLLVASGFSICGNSAIASVSGVASAKDEEVAAAVALVTLCGTAAILVVPELGALLGLTETQLGVWTGASVQDTAQVIAVASAVSPAVLAIATAVKLTRVLFLAPIVALVALRQPANATQSSNRPPLVPGFVVGFVAMLLLRSAGVVPLPVLDAGRIAEQYLLAAGMVGLGSAIRVASLRQLGMRPLVLGGLAWLVVGGVSLLMVQVAV